MNDAINKTQYDLIREDINLIDKYKNTNEFPGLINDILLHIKSAEVLYKVLEERLEKAVTIAYDIARGNEDVTNAKFGELSTEVICRANLENIQAIKWQIKTLQNQDDKEWGMAGGKYE